VEETSTQVQLGFTDALAAEGLLTAITAHQDRPIDPTVDDPARPILLAVSDNGPQMTSGSTREFMALCAIAQHFGRPGTPTDQAWIESLFGQSRPTTRTCSRSATRTQCVTNSPSSASTTTPSDCTKASATSPPTTNTKDEEKPSAKPAKPGSTTPANAGLPGTASTGTINTTRDPTMLANQTRSSIAKSDTRQS
jgi:hypothetical protein